MRKFAILNLVLSIFVCLFNTKTYGCTRVVYTGENNSIVMVGRTADWPGNVNSNIWMLPRGIKRNGLAGKNSINWISKYGSVVTTAHDILTIDGINEKGLSIGILRLKESKYIDSKNAKGKKRLGIALWGQYFLDNFASVNEAVQEMKKQKFYVVPLTVAEGDDSGMHLIISDASGDVAIFEYIDGKLNIYHNRNYKVVANSPLYSAQLAINDYWKSVGGNNFMPGTSRSSDRLVRGYYYINKLQKAPDLDSANAVLLSIMRNVSTPLEVSRNAGGENNDMSSTIWRTIINPKDKTYYFESSFKTYGFSIDLNQLNFSKGQSAKKIDLVAGDYYFGNATDKMVDAKPFTFFPSDGKEVVIEK